MSFFYSDDPVWDAERWIEAQERQLARFATCSRCGEYIQDEVDCLYDDDGSPICTECYEEEFEEETP